MATKMLDVHGIDKDVLDEYLASISLNGVSVTRRKKQSQGYTFYDLSERTGAMYNENLLVITGDNKEAITAQAKLEEKLGVKLVKPLSM